MTVGVYVTLSDHPPCDVCGCHRYVDEVHPILGVATEVPCPQCNPFDLWWIGHLTEGDES